MSTPVERLVELTHAKRNGEGWIAKCPAHDDERPSLSISEGTDGQALINCFAGCSTDAIVNALGWKVRDLFPENSTHQKRGHGVVNPGCTAGNTKAANLPIFVGSGKKQRATLPAAEAEQVAPQSLPSDKTAVDWEKYCTQFDDKSIHELSKLRGYKIEFCQWLRDNKLIGIYDGHVAFPVHGSNGKVVGVHYRVGDHWLYAPNGITTRPLVIGELLSGDPIHVFESQWDAFSYLDATGERSGIIVTRGAGNGGLVNGLIPDGSPAFLWTQNDEPDPRTDRKPGDQWQASICASTDGILKRVRIPDQHKDLNDWTRAGATPDDLRRAITEAATLRDAIVQTLDQFVVDPETNGGNLLGKRWLCRGGGVMVAAPTGVGKTTFQMQGAIMWALGRDFFGIKPTGKLRVLLIQAENDDGDMAEIRDGIFAGLNLSGEERAEACASIQVVCESAATSGNFIALIRRLVARHKPDLLIVDPFFAYLGGSVSDQETVSTFLRNWLNPILKEHGCGAIIIHHTNKPKTGKEKPDWQAGDFAYLGAGAMIANWARATIAIRSVGSYTVFSVELGKRGQRAGLVDDDGHYIRQFYIKHAEHGICWEAATDKDFEAQGKGKAKTADDVLRLVPMEDEISQARLMESAQLTGIGVNLTRELIEELLNEKPQRMFLWLSPSRTRPAKYYARHEQDLLNK